MKWLADSFVLGSLRIRSALRELEAMPIALAPRTHARVRRGCSGLVKY